MEPSKVSFDVSSSLKDYVEVHEIDHLRDTSLFDNGDSGVCNKCYPTTSYCRGHIGKILLNTNNFYINFSCRNKASELLSIVCHLCSLPIKATPKKCSALRQRLWFVLVSVYVHKCNCTGIKDSPKEYRKAYVLKDVYDTFKRNNLLDLFNKSFDLPLEDRLFRNFVPVLSYELLQQIPGGGDIVKCYRALLDNKGKIYSREEEYKKVCDFYDVVMKTCQHKTGSFRQVLVARKVSQSGRLVITPNPNIGIEDVVLPSVISRSMATNVTVTKDNFFQCLELIYHSRVNSIIYEKEVFKLASSNVHVRVTRCITHRFPYPHQQDIPFGSRLWLLSVGTLTTDYILTHDPNCILKVSTLETFCSMLHSKEIVNIVTPEGFLIVVDRHNLVSYYVETVLRRDDRLSMVESHQPMLTTRTPYQIGCKINTVLQYQQALIHRNPVLSADSIHTHRMLVHDKTYQISLSLSERQSQRERLTIPVDMLEEEDLGSIKVSSNYLTYSVSSNGIGMSRHSMVITSKVPKTCVTTPTIDLSMSINPASTRPYNADFDGDEMNIHLLEHAERYKSLSLFGDLEKGSHGIEHDAIIGLYFIVSNKLGIVDLHSQGYSILISNIQYLPDYTLSSLIDIGFSRRDSEEIVQLGLKSAKELIVYMSKFELPILSNTLETQSNGSSVVKMLYKGFDINTTMCVQDFFLKLRLEKDRINIVSPNKYNLFFKSYLLDEETLSIVQSEYCETSNPVSKLYTELLNFLYYLCDSHTECFSRLDINSCSTIIDSGARTKKATVDQIFKEIGYVSYILPKDNMAVERVTSNFSKGVDEKGMITLCFANRLQAVEKAINIAPEGDNMRLQSALWSSVNIGKVSIEVGKKLVSLDVTTQSYRDIVELEYINSCEDVSYFLDDNSPRYEYRDLGKANAVARSQSNIVHWGQRKLLMSEIYFLNRYVKDNSIDTIVYAGAASGSHIVCNVMLFPGLSWHLYDTGKFSGNLYDKTKANATRPGIKIYKEYLSPKVARERYYNRGLKILFISDIRSNSNLVSSKGSSPTDDDVSRDNKLNVDIVLSMDPIASIIKFRLPFKKGESTSLEGELLKQCWSKENSSEVRLISTRPYKVRTYDHTEHEEKMYAHNLVRHKKIDGAMLLTTLKKIASVYRLESYYDLYLESHIVSEYCKTNKCSEYAVYKILEESRCHDFNQATSRRKVANKY